MAEARTRPAGGAKIGQVLSSGPALNLIAIGGVLLIWQFCSTLSNFNAVLPGVPDTISRLGEIFGSWEELEPVRITLRRIVTGFIIGCSVGAILGALMGSVRVIREALGPYVNILRSVTPVAWVVPATVWLGVGEKPLYFIVVYASTFPVVINTMAGFAQVPQSKVRMAAVFGAGRIRTFFSVSLPSAVPFIIAGMRLALGYSFMSVVGGEMVAASSGLGFEIYNARVNFDKATMFAGIVIVGLAGYLGDRIFVLLQRRFARRFFAGQESS